MKVLTIRDPWAWAIVSHAKDVENRTWRTEYTGPVLMHAAARPAFKPSEDMKAAREWGREGFPWKDLRSRLGTIVGYARMTGCVPARECESDWAHCLEGGGGYCFLLEDRLAFREPIPLKGRLGLFDLPQEQTVAVANAFADLGRFDLGAEVYRKAVDRMSALRELRILPGETDAE